MIANDQEERLEWDSRVATLAGEHDSPEQADFLDATRLRDYLSSYGTEKLASVWFGPTPLESPDVAFVAASYPADDMEKLIAKQLEIQLARKLTSEHFTAIRERLAKAGFDDLNLFKLFQNDEDIKLKLPPTRLLIPSERARMIRTRKQLFCWVYDSPEALSRELNYIKLPTQEKLQLVRMLVHEVRSRYRWISSKTIHAMAFRPEVFDKRSNKNNAQRHGDGHRQQWDSLYNRAEIPKSRGKRYLWIPSPPLRRLQKAILRIIGPSLSRALPDYVFGCGTGRSATMFHNAACHVGNYFIANFDLQDFFPSTRISDIISGLHYCSEKQIPMVQPELLPSENNFKGRPTLAWKTDAKILIARLATHRGRLPQGSPLSPLLASVAFVPYDERIRNGLTQAFGGDHFIYTRYFDDITISIPKSVARKVRLDNPKAFMDRCIAILETSLKYSSFNLQARKNRASLVSTGHRVTGLIIKRNKVTLPRKFSKRIRSILHHLRKNDFVNVSIRWHEQSDCVYPKYISSEDGHRWDQSILTKKRMSAERLAVLMLRRQHPKLRVERMLPNWLPWTKLYGLKKKKVVGKKAWPFIEWLLTALWQRELSIRVVGSEGREIILLQGMKEVCKVRVKSQTLDFFLLSREEAIAVVRYWHFIGGIQGFLGASPQTDVFGDIQQLNKTLTEPFRAVKIQQLNRPRVINALDNNVSPDTAEKQIPGLAGKVISQWSEYRKFISSGILPKQKQKELTKEFGTPVTKENEYEVWTEACYELFVIGIAKFPKLESSEKHALSSPQLFDYLRLKHWRAKKWIADDYKEIADVDKTLGLESLEPDQYASAQYRIIQNLEHVFNEFLSRGTDDKDLSQKQEPNIWQASANELYQDQYYKFEKTYQNLQSRPELKKIFLGTSNLNILDGYTEQIKNSADKHSYWNVLKTFGKHLYKDMQERIDLSLWKEPLPERPEKSAFSAIRSDDVKRTVIWDEISNKFAKPALTHKTLQLVTHLRHLDSHEPDPRKRKDWIKVQKIVGNDVLDRNWQPTKGSDNDEYYRRGDLSLTEHEVQVVLYKCMREVVSFLQAMENQRNWKKLFDDAKKNFEWNRTYEFKGPEKHDVAAALTQIS